MGRQPRAGVSRFSVKTVWEGLAMTQFPGHMFPLCYSKMALDKKDQGVDSGAWGS